MSGIKRFAEKISVDMGFGGEITEEVLKEVKRQLSGPPIRGRGKGPGEGRRDGTGLDRGGQGLCQNLIVDYLEDQAEKLLAGAEELRNLTKGGARTFPGLKLLKVKPLAKLVKLFEGWLTKAPFDDGIWLTKVDHLQKVLKTQQRPKDRPDYAFEILGPGYKENYPDLDAIYAFQFGTGGESANIVDSWLNRRLVPLLERAGYTGLPITPLNRSPVTLLVVPLHAGVVTKF